MHRMRRVHVAQLNAGEIVLAAADAHHLRDVLRLPDGADVEVFDDAGRTAQGVIVWATAQHVVIKVENIRQTTPGGLSWTVASALPKGSRADWMIEKLCELGTALFVPLKTARAVVLPEGQEKRQRWMRLAAQAARQSRRAGVMRIDALTELGSFVQRLDAPAWYFTTEGQALSVSEALKTLHPEPARLNLLIGPEGGWTETEMSIMKRPGLTPVRLGGTILRVETAAVAAAAIAAAVVDHLST